MPGKLHSALEAAAAHHAERPAFTFLDANLRATSYTFAELWSRARVIGERLRERQLDQETRPLGILLPTQESQTLHYLGALCAGAVPAILTPPNRKLNREYYAITLAEVLRRSDFGALITDLDDVPLPVRTFEPGSIASSGSAEMLGDKPCQEELLDASFLQFSSGTTGIKRGVLVRDEAVLAQLTAYATALGIDATDRIVSWLPLYHDMGFIACLNMPLLFGSHTIVIDPISWVTRPSLFVQAVSRFEATLSWNPNFAYAFMAQRIRDRELEDVELSSLRGLVNCSEPVTHASQQQFLDRFAPYGLRADVFRGCYAMAETTFALTDGVTSDRESLDPIGPANGVRPGNEEEPYVSVGRPLEGVELAVVEEDGSPCPERHIGELWVRSPFNFTGYFQEPGASEEAFVDGWYRTGDLGYHLGNEYYVTGRRKDVLIVGGVNVFPHDVEDVVGSVDGIIPGRTAVFASFDPRVQTDRITILAESEVEDEGLQDAVMRVRQWVQASFDLAGFDVHLVPPGWLVKSSSGKMARSANREKWERKGVPQSQRAGGKQGHGPS